MADKITTGCLIKEEDLLVGNGEDFAVLDVQQDKILITVYGYYDKGNPYYQEEGYNSYSKRLFIYDWKRREVITEYDLEPNELCSAGILCMDGMVCVLSRQHGNNGEVEARIVKATGKNITKDICSYITYGDKTYYMPELLSFLDGSYAVSYFDLLKGEFGIKIVSPEGKHNTVYTNSSIEDFYGTEIAGNGEKFVYYTARNGTPVLVIGDQNNTVNSFSLGNRRLMHDFCMLKNYVLVSLREEEHSYKTDKVCAFDFDGEMVFSESHEPIFALTYSKENAVYARNMEYKSFVLAIQDEVNGLNLVERLVDIPKEFALYYPIDEQRCLAAVDIDNNSQEIWEISTSDGR